ncbi:MAG: tetratricopeptide repeat protein [Verrucomicrobiia bacterium]
MSFPGVGTDASCWDIARVEKNENASASQPRKTPAPSPQSGSPPPSRWRIRSFRAAAALAIPILILLASEGTLRWAGFGYPTSFFVEREIEGRASLIDNQEFGRRFFPPGLVRYPKPMALPVQKSAGSLRIFVFGESAAMGDPQPRFGLPRMLEALLRARFPGREIEVVNASMVAINSHVVLPIARECARREGDLWVIYMGNNEMIGPFGCISKFGAQAPPRAFVRASLALKRTRVGQAMDAALYGLRKGRHPPEQWAGMTLWADELIQPDDKSLGRVYAHFESNLRAILKAGRSAVVPMIVCTVATNVKDCAPFKSVHDAQLAPAELEAWQSAYTQGLDLERQGRYAEAFASYERALGLDRQFADLCYRAAHCALALGKAAQAQDLFHEARDRDALQFRTDTRLNEIIRRCALEYRGDKVELLEAEALLAAASPQQLAGRELFYEHVHLKPEGNYLLARAIAERAVTVLGLSASPEAVAGGDSSGGTTAAPVEWISEAACFENLGLTEWNRFQLLDEIRKRMEQPPFTLQVDHEEQLAKLREELQRSRAATKPFQVQRASQVAAQAVARRPDDPDLRWSLAELLDTAGDASGAEREWRAVIRMLPQTHYAYYNLGQLLESHGRAEEAVKLFEACVRIRPGDFDNQHALGALLVREGRPAEALPHLSLAVRQQPNSPKARLALAVAFQRTNRQADAAREFEEVLRLDPSNVEAREFLGRTPSDVKQ